VSKQIATSSIVNLENSAQSLSDAATLIIIDDQSGVAKILMGRRRYDQVFMPGKFVFPGGRVDMDDCAVDSVDDLAEEEMLKLLYDMKGLPGKSWARAIALAGIREAFEETGIIIGQKTNKIIDIKASGWKVFFNSGYQPVLSQLRFFARAVTPPGQPRRYDTRFFCVSAREISISTGLCDNELSDLGWFTISEALNLDLPLITRFILENLRAYLSEGPLSAVRYTAPYYSSQNGNMQRELIDISQSRLS